MKGNTRVNSRVRVFTVPVLRHCEKGFLPLSLCSRLAAMNMYTKRECPHLH